MALSGEGPRELVARPRKGGRRPLILAIEETLERSC